MEFLNKVVDKIKAEDSGDAGLLAASVLVRVTPFRHSWENEAIKHVKATGEIDPRDVEIAERLRPVDRYLFLREAHAEEFRYREMGEIVESLRGEYG